MARQLLANHDPATSGGKGPTTKKLQKEVLLEAFGSMVSYE